MSAQSGSGDSSNLQRLIEARVVDRTVARELGDEQLGAIEDMSDDEVETLIDLRKKIGEVPPGCFLI